MKHLYKLFRHPLREIPSKLAIFILIVGLLGFADATYLTVEHFQGRIPPCSITSGCEKVLTSEYSAVAGIPVSLLGSIYYLILVIGMFLYLESKHSKALKAHHMEIIKWTLLGTAFGMGASLWFLYLQVFVLHSYCIYCLGSIVTSSILFVTAIYTFKKYHSLFEKN